MNYTFNKALSPVQLQIVLGGLLGDSSISPRPNGACRLKINHSRPWKDYLLWKRDILKKFFLQDKPNVQKPSSLWGTNDSLSFHSIQHQVFSELFGLFYSSEKKKRHRRITWKSIEHLDELGALVWYLDDGCLIKDKREPIKGKTVSIYSDAYSLSEQRILKKWFWKRLKIEAKIQHDITHDVFYLRFNRKESLALLTIFQKFIQTIPASMRYKLDA